ncbi:Patatin family phospholipase, putative [Talaromyces stipitatus ATCC 10500]|uniref:Patatin-like phospholipase domain-containing protein n=1 Tax=Talaromyces stipitatus (strain ATCC 10500 / CBS 375.48 / QM 6759 / NRRL 1006) TaxID=441959 RepID=B8MGD9_TALSN|nr:Patatin family phospholipase, putative [Talaromyces stipitatus ATCC 10500]EED16259.1 Patatin family phospholipase, putative [Talaromyces stipitatus ATCC 10500]
MTTFRDPTSVHAQIHRKQGLQLDRSQKGENGVPKSSSSRLAKRVSIAAFSSLVKDGVAWTSDRLNTYRDRLSKEGREEKLRRDNRRQLLYLKMRNAVSFEEWRSCACELDELEGNNKWKEIFDSDEYNPDLVLERMRELEDARISCDVSRMLFLVRTALTRDLGNMSSASLYRHSHIGTKNLIDQYITTALSTISTLLDLSGSDRSDSTEMQYILDQLLSARQAFGRSAISLSGGGTFGMNHVGVIKALWEAKLVPRIISGASAGSIVASIFCAHTDDQIPAVLEAFPYGDLAVFEPEGNQLPPLQKMARLLKYGSVYDSSNLERVMKNWLGNMTFHEAYNRTRKILNICISSAGLYELPRLLNYITAPNVLIWSAITVSCSVPFVFSPSVLMAKDPLTGENVPWHNEGGQWIDGSVDGDLPMTRLAEMFNVNHFIVSQVNPHVLPFLEKETGPATDDQPQAWFSSPWLNSMTSLARDEALHRMNVFSEMGVFQNQFMKTASILSQKYSGDINIYPEIPYAHFLRILQNPTTEFILQTCLNGERATWPVVSRVRNHLAIELALDSAVQTMRARVALSPPVTVTLSTSHPTAQSRMLSERDQRPDMFPRRSSYSEAGRAKNTRSSSQRRPNGDLRKAHSFVSIEIADLQRSFSPVHHYKHAQTSSLTESPQHNRANVPRYNADESYFIVPSDSDDESYTSWPQRPNMSRHATWSGPPLSGTSRSGRTSPAISRRSSIAKTASNPSRPTSSGEVYLSPTPGL